MEPSKYRTARRLGDRQPVAAFVVRRDRIGSVHYSVPALVVRRDRVGPVHHSIAALIIRRDRIGSVRNRIECIAHNQQGKCEYRANRSAGSWGASQWRHFQVLSSSVRPRGSGRGIPVLHNRNTKWDTLIVLMTFVPPSRIYPRRKLPPRASRHRMYFVKLLDNKNLVIKKS